MKNLNLKNWVLLFAIILISSSSCSEDSSPNICANVDDEITAYLSELTSNFFQNPTPANCEVWKSNFINFLSRYERCNAFRADVREAIKEWREIDCSEFD